MNHFHTQTSKIEQIKSWFHSPLGGILKYIQYGELFLNQDFFVNESEINQDGINKFIQKIDIKLSEIKSQKKEINNLYISDLEKNFLINALNITGFKYILFKSSVYFEAEKFWYQITDEERKILLKRINKLQDIIYGPEISSIESEKKLILSELTHLFLENKNKLVNEEIKTFQDFIEPFHFDITSIKKDEDSNIFREKYLPKEKVIQIFKMVLDLYWLTWWKIVVDNVWNLSVKKEKKQIILPESKIEKINLKRIFQLIDHEIWVHVLRWYNTDKTLKTNGEWYLESEEWFAILSEALFDNKLEDINVKPTIHHITTFIAENRNFIETKKLLEIYYKLLWNNTENAKKEAEDRTLRIKRFVSHYEKWANRKDVSYTRWQQQIVDYLQNNQDNQNFIKDFYFSKLALDDISSVKEFRDILWIDENELKYPLWIWKILYKKLSWEKIFLEKLKQEDLRFKNIEKISFAIKRKIIHILSMIHNN